ncbi:MAG TPA: glycosyltransferase family 4 protein, partial [Coriobacteriia bacterium]|nr:glycosyltransferase family 4 protein [Coriobacteriia bacterium]
TPNGNARRKTVLFVNSFPGPTLGGGETHLMHLVRGARAAGWRVAVAAAADGALARDAREAGAHVFEIEYSRTRAPAIPGRLRAIAEECDADVIVGTGFFTNMLVRRAAGRFLRAKAVNIVHTEPDASRHEGSGTLALGVRKRVDAASHGRVDRFVAVSSAVRDALSSDGVDPERVVTIVNGIDIERLRAEARLPAPEGVRAPGPLVGFVGRLAPVKGAEHFVRMAAILSFRVPRSRFVIAGSGPEEDRLRGSADARGLAGRLRFLGHVSPAAPVLNASDVVVVPSLSEGFSLVAAEAMALAKPVVATRVGGLADVVVDGETGLLVPPADPEALAAAVARLLRDPALTARLGEAGSRRVEECFTVERMVREHLELFEGLAATA